RVNKDGHPKLFTRGKDLEELRLAQVKLVDVRTYLDARETVLLAAFKLLDRKIRCLHGQRREADKTFRMPGDVIRDVVIQEFCDRRAVLRFCPIAEHHRNRREHLYINSVPVHLGNTRIGRPAIILDLTKTMSVVAHHRRRARVDMIEANKSAVTELLLPAWDLPRQNVCVNVDL